MPRLDGNGFGERLKVPLPQYPAALPARPRHVQWQDGPLRSDAQL